MRGLEFLKECIRVRGDDSLIDEVKQDVPVSKSGDEGKGSNK